MATGDDRGIDPGEIIEVLEEQLLGSAPELTALDIAERVGISMEVARQRWRSLGFSAVEDDEIAFTQADLEALQLTQRLHELGLVDPESESALIRTLGRSFARLAEWQLTLLGQVFDIENLDREQLRAVSAEVAPVIEDVMNYVWRRHTVMAASRMLLAPHSDGGQPEMAVGFADIVGYTRQSRSLSKDELGRLVEEFEDRALAIVTAHGGRIIKTIGDEVLFVADQAPAAARIALELLAGHRQDQEFPQLRIGLAYGEVLSRLGDVFGPVVNLAARLTSTARPGKALADKDLAAALQELDPEEEEFRLRRMRRTSVKGYRHLEPWALKAPRPLQGESIDLRGPASSLQQERGQDLVRVVDEVKSRRERSSGTQGAEELPGG